jgi:uncharacterized membrane protein YkvA (DUF1232 family)
MTKDTVKDRISEFLDQYRASTLKLSRQVKVLYLAYQNPKTPIYAKFLIGLVISYAISPIDLIPDFIPILGMIDDLLIVPIGVYWCLKLIPNDVIEEAQLYADLVELRKSIWSAIAVVSVWLGIAAWFILKLIRLMGR